MSAMARTLNIGMVGGGVVGGGVYEILRRNGHFRDRGLNIHISKICVKDPTKPRDFDISPDTEVVTNVDAILDDERINCVVEVMGGTTLAKSVVLEAIRRGKHVVSANKTLIAHAMEEIQQALAAKRSATGGETTQTRRQEQEQDYEQLAVEQQASGESIAFGYEAAVCGGIPIIDNLQRSFAGDEIEQVAGIMNGTTNFILSKMEREGANYSCALKEAQERGFAEADPASDVEGLDVQQKLAILTKLCFGFSVPPSSIPTEGITKISSTDFEYAASANMTIKLLGVARKVSSDSVSVFVSPVLLSRTSDMGAIGGATNIVNVASKYLKSSSFIGEGAGRFPTANSVVNDLVHIAERRTSRPFPEDTQMKLLPQFNMEFYVRLTVRNEIGVIKRIGAAAEVAGVSINAIQQNLIKHQKEVSLVVRTEQTSRAAAERMCQELETNAFLVEKPILLPVMRGE